MGENIIIDTVYELSHYAPLVILVATFLDMLIFTGYILYGAAMLGSVLMLHATGIISTEALLISAYAGTMIGSACNYLIGRFLGKTVYIQRILSHPRVTKVEQYLTDRGLFIFMFTARFITFVRPVYAVLLGSMKISARRFFLYEAIIAFVWVSFWLFIIIRGEALYFKLFS